ncbi:deoxyribodipyrimidine photo-lyase [Rubellimicrobium sp. CFH 75288]|uniref:cryptochrome/photolyase family protein n=1 Tax=Rubellimicrobium sp. CFH 75288 TaxID=2697034 RepID=UPI001412714E|nr:deoxyribodipyrimidine photo-lyase [Rubellimicrobium sp. CFH 75288]NAZ36262.1 deoxyribodipyrimidine photo-lyase [Rubellimicrobium sp. CFH 75288]
MDRSPVIVWFRRDLRLSDHPALHEAAATGRPVIPVALRDEGVDGIGAAARLRWGLSVARLAAALGARGSRLILRAGPAADALAALVRETGAGAVWWTRLHDPLSRRLEAEVRAALGALDLRARPGHLLHEPEAVATAQGTPFRLYAPFQRAVAARDPGEPLPAPSRLPAPDRWPASDDLAAWHLGAAMNRAEPIVAAHQHPGEDAARDRLGAFAEAALAGYARGRNDLSGQGSSGLSEHLAWGEISAREVWHRAGLGAGRGAAGGAEAFRREIAWREFCHHLLFHFPHIESEPFRPGWETFPWRDDARLLLAWRQGRTGLALADAGMRQMWVTGRMHNRMRMLTASVLVKTMGLHPRHGQAVFADCLTDWDPANNAVNWQWVAGSGPDAAPFFRVFSPEAQAREHDPDGAYRRRWLAEGQADPPPTALAFFDCVPRRWGLSPADPPPRPVVDAAEGRRRALADFARWREGQVRAGQGA